MVIIWAAIWFDSRRVLQEKLSDLTYIVSEENCLSKDGGLFSSYDKFEKRLEEAETDWLYFKTSLENDGERLTKLPNHNSAVFVGSTDKSKTYYSYADAPQRGNSICIMLEGELRLPLFFAPDSSKTPASSLSMVRTYTSGDRAGLKYVSVPLTVSYTPMGVKFYKAK